MTGGSIGSTVPWHFRINLARPCVDATFKRVDGAEALLFQKGGGVPASDAVVTVAHDGRAFRRRGFLPASGQFVQRDELTFRKDGQGVFRGLADVKQVDRRAVAQPGGQVGGAHG